MKKRNLIFSCTFVVMATLLTAALPVSAHPGTETVYLNENFSGQTVGVTPPDVVETAYSVTYGEGTMQKEFVVADPDNTSGRGNVIEYSGNNSNPGYLNIKNLTSATNKAKVEMDFRIKLSDAASNFKLMYTPEVTGTALELLNLKGTFPRALQINNTASTWYTPIKVPVDTWMRIKFTVDSENNKFYLSAWGDILDGTTGLDIDEKTYSNVFTIPNDCSTVVEGFSKIHMEFVASASNKAAIYLDDIKATAWSQVPGVDYRLIDGDTNPTITTLQAGTIEAKVTVPSITTGTPSILMLALYKDEGAGKLTLEKVGIVSGTLSKATPYITGQLSVSSNQVTGHVLKAFLWDKLSTLVPRVSTSNYFRLLP